MLRNAAPACPHLPARQALLAADIVVISDNATLGLYLSGLFRQSSWTVARARSCRAGIAFLRKNRAAVTVCEDDLPDGSWRDVAAALEVLPDAPALVVVGDDPASLQNVVASGGFDVLVRPMRDTAVVWTVASAWHAWMKRFEEGAGGGS
jgi:DNA-binding NtrC family response regulator